MSKIYIIPGLGETGYELQYKKLSRVFKRKGYEPIIISPNWYKPLSEQTFCIEKDAIVFGFSFGAIIAYLIARMYPMKHLILASISPLETFSFKDMVEDSLPYMSREMAELFARDLKEIHVDLTTLKVPYITFAGEKESMQAHVCVPKTGHVLNKAYITAVSKNLEGRGTSRI